ncbi:DUF4367 domain-containing protein [Vallitalea guaymasensis]|uniref:DUF4367 domain-containing protein n=1 Tax=Vallitalea guaymasensis TaxID=1185412 RepID=UPI000DE4F323|nr:DUF4367 domain-containing protein [Vallitalea guaymasensis]
MKQTDMDTRQKNKIFESYYGYIGSCHIKNIIADQDNEGEEINEVEFPKNIDEWFVKFHRKYRRKERVKKLNRRFKKAGCKVAVLLLLVISMGTVLSCTVEAFRIKILNFFIEDNKEYTSVQVKEDEESIPDSWSNYYYPEYLPQDFRLDKSEIMNDKKILRFIDGDKFILITQSPNGTNYQMDTEDAEADKIVINDYEGLLIEKQENTTIIWHNEECSFNIISNIISDELMKVVKSLEKR